MNKVLDRILLAKRKAVDHQKTIRPLHELEQAPMFRRNVRSLRKCIREFGQGIIAEIKRKSPSRQWINAAASAGPLAAGYEHAGASAISVLTDNEFFGGSEVDLLDARAMVSCPILRKEFVIDEYQVVESKTLGADAILLIAAILEPVKIQQLSFLAHNIGLEVLVEVHNELELASSLEVGPDIIGVNNRNLDSFEVSLDVSRRLASQFPPSITRISESGIHCSADALQLRACGYHGFLIGEQFMGHERPDIAAGIFIQELAMVKGENV